MALNEAGLVDVLHSLLNAVARNFHTESQVLGLRDQINGVIELVEEDAEKDVAGLVTVGEPVAVK